MLINPTGTLPPPTFQSAVRIVPCIKKYLVDFLHLYPKRNRPVPCVFLWRYFMCSLDLFVPQGQHCILILRMCWYTVSIPNIRNTFLILSCTSPFSFCPQISLNTSGHGLYKVLKAFHRDAGPSWLQCLRQLCQVVWMSFGWWIILDTYIKLLSVKNPAPLQFLTQTVAPGTYYHTLFKGT